MNDKCVVCGRQIDKEFIGEEIVCADYCKGILEGKRQGAIEELRLMKEYLKPFSGFFVGMNKHIEKRLLELKGEK